MGENKDIKLFILLVLFSFSAITLAIPTADARGTGHHVGGNHAGFGSHGGHRSHIGGHRGNRGGNRHFGGGHKHFGGGSRHFSGGHKHIGGHRSNYSGVGRHRPGYRQNYNYYPRSYGYSYKPRYSSRSYSSYSPRAYSPRSYSTYTPSYFPPTPYISISTSPANYSKGINTYSAYSSNSADASYIEKDMESKVTNNAEVSLLTTDIEWNTVSACLSSKKSCSCYGYSGDRLAVPKESCELAAKYGWSQKPKKRT